MEALTVRAQREWNGAMKGRKPQCSVCMLQFAKPSRIYGWARDPTVYHGLMPARLEGELHFPKAERRRVRTRVCDADGMRCECQPPTRKHKQEEEEEEEESKRQQSNSSAKTTPASPHDLLDRREHTAAILAERRARLPAHLLHEPVAEVLPANLLRAAADNIAVLEAR